MDGPYMPGSPGGGSSPRPERDQQPMPYQQFSSPPWPAPGSLSPASHRRRGLLMGLGVAVAIILGASGLIVSLLRGNGSSADGETATIRAAIGETAEVDRALREAVGPLLRESADSGKRFAESRPHRYAGEGHRDRGLSGRGRRLGPADPADSRFRYRSFPLPHTHTAVVRRLHAALRHQNSARASYVLRHRGLEQPSRQLRRST